MKTVKITDPYIAERFSFTSATVQMSELSQRFDFVLVPGQVPPFTFTLFSAKKESNFLQVMKANQHTRYENGVLIFPKRYEDVLVFLKTIFPELRTKAAYATPATVSAPALA